MPDPKEPYSEEERIRVAAGSVGGDAASARETDAEEDAAPKRRHLIPDSRLPLMEDPDEEAHRMERKQRQADRMGGGGGRRDFGETNKTLGRLFLLAGLVLLGVLVWMLRDLFREGEQAQDSASALLEAYYATTPVPGTPEPSAVPAQPEEVTMAISGSGETDAEPRTDAPQDGAAENGEAPAGADAVNEAPEEPAPEGSDEQTAAEDAVAELLLPGNGPGRVDESGAYEQPDAPEVDASAEVLASVIAKVGEGAVLGVIEIPEIDIELPVISKWSYSLLRVSVCRYKGPGMNQKGNLVIIGHNYRSGAHFGKLSKLKNGSAIYLTDPSGNKVRYEVYKKLSIEPDDFSALNKYSGKYGLTLMTCQSSGTKRLLLRCVQKDADIPSPR